ncbi:hypothetical protein GCM10010365_10170 [Streptomyces poonensis]|uniref:Uncharacterized protein n=1 Tax=Streptomyces poonensis TaxID=68255 RepID=A0A918UDM2_9ACTN|nr:hypothetical protein GCM10010365_10170 [Streptomyces poonensis]GLJ87543.1 hypothetical protein GCM10017589_01430 [Streptomyces poonensis]
MRGLLDVHNQVMAWRAARHEHRTKAEQSEEPPRLRDYFDALPDIVAVVGNAALGAITAGLFAIQGQISGAYAAIAVGLSAPALLFQIGQVQPVSASVSGVPQNSEHQPTGTDHQVPVPPTGLPPAQTATTAASREGANT